MGNCFSGAPTKIVGAAQSDGDIIDQLAYAAATQKEDEKKKKKTTVVSWFKVDDQGTGTDRSVDGVRIRVVVTQKELKQLLESGIGPTNRSSVELLVGILRSRRRPTTTVVWRPALLTIPEDDIIT